MWVRWSKIANSNFILAYTFLFELDVLALSCHLICELVYDSGVYDSMHTFSNKGS